MSQDDKMDREHKVFKVKIEDKKYIVRCDFLLLYFSGESNTKWYMDTKLLLCFPIFNLNLIYL